MLLVIRILLFLMAGYFWLAAVGTVFSGTISMIIDTFLRSKSKFPEHELYFNIGMASAASIGLFASFFF